MKKSMIIGFILCCISHVCFSTDVKLPSLVEAVEQGHCAVVVQALAREDSEAELGLALAIATYYEDLNIIAILLQKRRCIEQRDIDVAISSAQASGRVDIVNLLQNN